MFCNKDNVNILTAVLLAYGIEDAVVCPGSRNAVIVHNLNECAKIATPEHPLHLHSVTDERSAAFVAIGLWLRTRKPIVVCVTSGSALLNLLPGVAEAYYRHIPLIVLSADRPAEWIGQLDGQTLPQPEALRLFAKCWNVPDDLSPSEIERRCIAAIGATKSMGGSPVHVNLPIAEPLFHWTVPSLPKIQIPVEEEKSEFHISEEVMKLILNARHPALIIGQYEDGSIPGISMLQQHGWTIFAENISNQGIYNDTLTDIDLLVHIGGCLVEKRLKLQLRELIDLPIIRIDETDDIPATFGHVTHKLQCSPAEAIAHIAGTISASGSSFPPHQRDAEKSLPIEALFLGNSTTVRWTNRNFRISAPTYCNRGTNGIEGTLSVAAGYSLATNDNVLCILGDLSFFYDNNALWNKRLSGNLRILLVNNNKGGIFYQLPHLSESDALEEYIAAHHYFNAAGIADSYDCKYLRASTQSYEAEIDDFVNQLLSVQSNRPVILEVILLDD